MTFDHLNVQSKISNNILPPAIFLMGVTSSGKTDLAIALSEILHCELISVDSVLVYKGMNIGTAKPSAKELARVPHMLIDINDPSEPYSAANFRKDALQGMSEITARGKIPLLVGGTMLYFKILRDGLARLPAANAVIRNELLAQAKKKGWAFLYTELQRIDPAAGMRIKPSDTQRVQRALEVYKATGKTLSKLYGEQKYSSFPYEVTNLAIAPKTRSVLHQRIENRFQLMLQNHFIDEVRVLYARKDLTLSLPAIRSVGYRQIWSYLKGELDHSMMVEKGIIATRQLAKRQLTWLKSWPDVHWLDSLSKNLLNDALKCLKSLCILSKK